jgi:hypothetical protein
MSFARNDCTVFIHCNTERNTQNRTQLFLGKGKSSSTSSCFTKENLSTFCSDMFRYSEVFHNLFSLQIIIRINSVVKRNEMTYVSVSEYILCKHVLF